MHHKMCVSVVMADEGPPVSRSEKWNDSLGEGEPQKHAAAPPGVGCCGFV